MNAGRINSNLTCNGYFFQQALLLVPFIFVILSFLFFFFFFFFFCHITTTSPIIYVAKISVLETVNRKRQTTRGGYSLSEFNTPLDLIKKKTIHAKLNVLISPFVHKVFRKHSLIKLNVRFSILQVNRN